MYVPLTALLSLPLSLYADFFREHQYGLSNQTLGAWARDQLVGLAVGVVLASVLVALLYAVIRRAPRTWWAWGAFNEYETVDDPAVATPILRLARANEMAMRWRAEHPEP